MGKLFFLFCAIIFCYSKLDAQIQSNDDFYKDALRRHISYMNTWKIKSRDTIFIYNETNGQYKMPDTLEGKVICVLDYLQLKEQTRKTGLPVLVLGQLLVEDKNILVVVSHFGARYRKKRLNLIKSQHSYYYYTYGSSSWDYQKTKHEDR